MEATVDALFLSDEIAQHGLPVADLLQRAVECLRLIPVQPGVGVVVVEHHRPARVVPNDLGAASEHEVEHLVHGLPRGLLDELVHQRVAGRFLARQRDQMSACHLGTRPRRECGAQAHVVVAEWAGDLAQDDEPANVVAYRHGHGKHAAEMKILGQVADQLGQGILIARAEGKPCLHRRQQGAGVLVRAVDRLGTQALDPDTGRLGNVTALKNSVAGADGALDGSQKFLRRPTRGIGGSK